MKKNLALVLLLLASISAWGAVALDPNLAGNWVAFKGANISSLTTPNIPVSAGANRLLLCGAIYDTGNANPAAAVSTATFNGTAMSLLDSQRIALVDGKAVAELWFLKNPANTSAPVIVNWSASVADGAAICWAFTGANQSSTFGSVAKGGGAGAGDPSITVGSQSGAIVAEFTFYDGPFAPHCLAASSWPLQAGCTEASRSQARYPVFASQLKFTGSTTVPMDWDMTGSAGGGRGSSIVAVSINP